MASRFAANRAFEAELKRSPAYKAEMAVRAKAGAEAARRIAPRGPTGDYVESIQVDGNRVLTDDPAGHLIEWGSVNNVSYAPLRKGAEATGAKVVNNGGGT